MADNTTDSDIALSATTAPLAYFAETCTASSLPQQWQFLPAAPNCLRTNTPGDVLLRDLRSRFGDKQLRIARFLAPSENDHETLNPVVCPDDRLVLVPTLDGVPQDIVTRGGTLSGVPPLFALLRDDLTRRCLADLRVMFIASNLTDVVILRALGVAAAPVTGTGHLTALQWGRLLPGLGGTVAAETLELGENVRFVFLGWSIGELNRSVPNYFRALVRHVWQALRLLQLDFGDRVYASLLNATALEQLRTGRELQSVPIVGRLLTDERNWHSLHHLVSSADWPGSQPSYERTLRRVLEVEQLQSRPESHLTREEVQTAHEQHERQVLDVLIRPALIQAFATQDATARILSSQFAHLAHLAHRMLPSLLAQQSQRLGLQRQYGTAHDEPLLPRKTWDQMRQVTGLMLQVARTEMAIRPPDAGRSASDESVPSSTTGVSSNQQA